MSTTEQTFVTLTIKSDFSKTVTSFAELEDLYYFTYAIDKKLDLLLTDLTISTLTGKLVIAQTEYEWTEQAASNFCKFLKIPFKFGQEIPTTLLKDNVEYLKTLRDREVRLLINKEGVIVNIIRPTIDYAEEHFSQLLDWLKTDVKQEFFHSAFFSYRGFSINYKMQDDAYKIDDETFSSGKSFVGDFYQINRQLSMALTMYRQLSNGKEDLALFNDHVFCPKYNLFATRKVKISTEYYQTLRESFKEDFELGLKFKTLQEVLDYAHDTDMNISTYLYVAKKLKALTNRNQDLVYTILAPEEVNVVIQSEYETIKEKTHKTKINFTLQTTPAKDVNTLIAFYNFINFASEGQFNEFLEIQDIAQYILFDTYQNKI